MNRREPFARPRLSQSAKSLRLFHTIIFDTQGGRRLVRITVPYWFARRFADDRGEFRWLGQLTFLDDTEFDPEPIRAFVLLAAGCSGYWGRRPVDQPTPTERHAPVWIWSGGEVNKWHAVVITQDSVSGIPYEMSVHCGSCWRSIPRTRVDSMKLGYRTLPENVTIVVGLATAAIVVEAALCYLIGAQNDGQC